MSELHLILFTLGTTSLIVVLSSFIGLRWLFRRGWKNKGATPTPIGIGILACGAAVVSCFLYSLLVEPYWLDISHIKLQSTKIPIGTKGFRVAHISDIHSDPAARLEEKLPSIIAAEKPDLIVLTGDCIVVFSDESHQRA
jgi:amino acid transporter